jgi:hypothetical protein
VTAQAPVPPRCGWSWHTDDAEAGHRHECGLDRRHGGRHECHVMLHGGLCKERK